MTEMRSTPAASPSARRRFPQGSLLAIRELPLTGIIGIQGAETADLGEGMHSVLGMQPPPIGAVVSNSGIEVSSTAPAEWLVFCPEASEHGLVESLRSACASSFATITVLSDCKSGFEVSGPAATDLLSSGCALDLDAAVFSPGTVAATRFATLPALLMRAAEDRFRLYIDVSYAAYLTAWLIESSTEFQELA
jgi:sarcosine oxidase, subunit gamma